MWRRIEVEALTQQALIRAITAHRLRHVAGQELGVHERPQSSFPQRLALDHGKRCEHGSREVPRVDAALGERLEREQRVLPQTLALGKHPFLVPTWQQLVEVAAQHVDRVGRCRTTKDGAHDPPRLVQVNLDVGAKAHILGGVLEYGYGQLMKPPQCRTQTRVRPALGYLSPETARDVRASGPSPLEGKKGDDTLRTVRNHEAS